MEDVDARASPQAFHRIVLADALQSLALVFLQATLMAQVYGGTGSVLGATSVVVASAGGLMAGGVYGARHLQKGHEARFLSAAGWLRAALTLGLGAWWAGGGAPASLLGIGTGIALTFLASAVSSVYDAAIFAVLPRLVPRSLYIRANGMLSVVHQLTRVAGWGLGGLIAGWWSPGTVAAMVALMFAFSGVAAGRVRIPSLSPAEGRARERGWKTGRSAWQILFAAGVVRHLTIMDLVEALANTVWASSFTLAFTGEVLGARGGWWGLINAAYWAGALWGTTVVIVFSRAIGRRAGSMLWLSALGMALLTLAFAESGSPLMAIALCVLMGPVYQVREICQATILQDAVPPAVLSGVAAARNAILGPWSMGAFVLMGTVADLAGIGPAYVFAAVLYGLTALVVWTQPALRAYRYRVPAETSS